MKGTNKNIWLQQIAYYLLINSSYLTNLSLFHGKMGIVLFLYNYARYTKNPVYEEVAGNPDEILEDIGVMPSMHEQCSYVAIEMQMFGIPLITSDSTGLKEMNKIYEI